MKSKGVRESFYGKPFERTPMIAVMGVGKRIKALRLAKGLDQGELARAAKIAQSTLSDLERGDSERPRGDSLVRLAAVLEVDHDWLMTGQGIPTPKMQPNIDEGHLLTMYRDLSEANRAALLATARALLDSQPDPTPSSPLKRAHAKHRTQ
jgi:transcriptional regulator with XRE-family HTH domain